LKRTNGETERYRHGRDRRRRRATGNGGGIVDGVDRSADRTKSRRELDVQKDAPPATITRKKTRWWLKAIDGVSLHEHFTAARRTTSSPIAAVTISLCLSVGSLQRRTPQNPCTDRCIRPRGISRIRPRYFTLLQMNDSTRNPVSTSTLRLTWQRIKINNAF